MPVPLAVMARAFPVLDLEDYATVKTHPAASIAARSILQLELELV
jgi:hypothetical protein